MAINNNEIGIFNKKKYPKYFETAVYAMTLTGMWKSATDKTINIKNISIVMGLNVLGIILTLASLCETEEFNVYSGFESLIYLPLFSSALIGCMHMVRKGALMEQMYVIVEKGFDSFHDTANTKATLARNKADDDARFRIRCVAYIICCAHFFKFISTNAWNPYSTNRIAFIPLSVYFYKSDSLLFYYIMYSLQFSVSAACATLNVICIVVCAGLLDIFCSEIDALKFSFEDPNSIQITETNIIKKDNAYYQTDDANKELFYNRLKTLVNQHTNLLRIRKEMEQLISPIAFIMFVISEFIVCFCIFQIYQLFKSSEELDMPLIMNRVSLFFALMAQQFVYFVVGQQLESKSVELHRYLYYSNWYQNTSRYNSAMRIMFERTKSPFTLKAGFLIPINLSSFVTCMQATFSYFNLLRALSL